MSTCSGHRQSNCVDDASKLEYEPALSLATVTRHAHLRKVLLGLDGVPLIQTWCTLECYRVSIAARTQRGASDQTRLENLKI